MGSLVAIGKQLPPIYLDEKLKPTARSGTPQATFTHISGREVKANGAQRNTNDDLSQRTFCCFL